jgi:hypothetical protein
MRSLAAVVLASLAAACANLGPQDGGAAAVSRIVAGAVHATRSPAAERRRILARAEEAFLQEPGDAARLQLATLLATLAPPLRDDARAAALLEPLRGGATQTPIARFAALLAAQVAERRQLVQAGLRREGALRRQVEALRAIEREMSAREE